MVRLSDGVRRDPEDAVFALCFAATIVFAALGWWSAAVTAFALGIGGAIVIDALWPDGFARDTGERDTAASDTESTADALDTLRDRYASGDLGDEEFERKLEALLETETPDGARRRVERDADVVERDSGSIERDAEPGDRIRED
ncbi:SHOCT domain-containing protein [Halorubrum tibetense]|uniref:SHOCT domain-containing protein n=1 Tax=Halorubrum tibetense TaxID=175631 RepID=A0ABD5SBW5_9EURY